MEPTVRSARTQSRIAAAPAREPELRQRKTRNTASTAVRLRAQPRPPGTEFLDAETGRQKSPQRRLNACRDQNPRNERPEIPAETPCLVSCRKPAVYEDWVVETVGLELVTHQPVIEPVSGQSRERSFRPQRQTRKCLSIRQRRPGSETRKDSKNPYSGAQGTTRANRVRALETAWWRQ